MVTIWRSAAGVIHYNFMNPGETIAEEKYSWEIYEMRRKIHEKQLALLNKTGPIMLHDNVTLHVSQRTLRKLKELSSKICLICLTL